MTVRTSDLVMSILLALVSIGFMIKSAELNIGWIEGRGPGAGAWPFWLSAGMLLASLVTLYRWLRSATAESRNTDLFMTRDTVLVVGTSAGAILMLLIATHLIGIYGALVLFLLLYIRFVGRHSWIVTILLTIGIPIFVFCLFEWALKIPLPKSISEPLFYPIYELMYS